MSLNILIVEDEEPIRQLLGNVLQINGYQCTLAANALEARDQLNDGRFELALCDLNMPGESGLELMQYILTQHPDTAAITVTAVDDPEVARTALEIGVYGYIIKPFGINEILINVANALRRRKLEIDNRIHLGDLEQIVHQRTSELRETVSALEEKERELREREAILQSSLTNYRIAVEGIVYAMARTMEMRDPYTAGHQRRVVDLARVMADQMGVSDQQKDCITMACVIHDLGKIAVPAEILSKPGRITELEYSLIKTHPQVGFDILKNIKFPWPIASIVLQHHERLDGSGYPSGLSGEAILPEAKILAVADVVEAIASHRPYRPGLGVKKALKHIMDHRGILYDADAVNACSRVFKETQFKFQ
jgi:putative two-component system response regulator